MIIVNRAALGGVVLLVAVGLAAGCGKSGSSGAKAPPTVQGAGCAPVGGSQLVVLADDKKLQTVDNIVPAVNAKAVTPELIAALNRVSAALDTPKLIALNKAVDVDRKTPKVAAEEFASASALTAGIVKGRSGKVIIGAANFSENQ